MITKKGRKHYGETQVDIREELRGYSKANGYLTVHFADAICLCESRLFHLSVDDETGAAERICTNCDLEHLIGDSEEYIDEAELEESECLCGKGVFEITVGVALYRDSDDVRWIYIGCRCPSCSLVGCYGDWKNEYGNYRVLLARV